VSSGSKECDKAGVIAAGTSPIASCMCWDLDRELSVVTRDVDIQAQGHAKLFYDGQGTLPRDYLQDSEGEDDALPSARPRKKQVQRGFKPMRVFTSDEYKGTEERQRIDPWSRYSGGNLPVKAPQSYLADTLEGSVIVCDKDPLCAGHVLLPLEVADILISGKRLPKTHRRCKELSFGAELASRPAMPEVEQQLEDEDELRQAEEEEDEEEEEGVKEDVDSESHEKLTDGKESTGASVAATAPVGLPPTRPEADQKIFQPLFSENLRAAPPPLPAPMPPDPLHSVSNEKHLPAAEEWARPFVESTVQSSLATNVEDLLNPPEGSTTIQPPVMSRPHGAL